MFYGKKSMVLATLLLAPLVSMAGEGGRKISVLFTGYRHHDCAFQQAGRLMKDGFNVDRTPRSLKDMTLTNELLKKWNVVVLTGVGMANANGTLTKRNKENIAAILKFVENGGGVIYIPTWCQQNGEIPPQLEFGKRIGARPFFDKVIFDPDNTKVATAWNIPFAYTANFAETPVTSGIRGLWYPVATRVGAQTHTTVTEFDKNWKILASTAKTAYVRSVKNGGVSATVKGAESKTRKAIPLCAMRKFGKGEIIVFAVTPEYLFGRNALTTLEGIVYSKGLRGLPSDGFKFVENMLRACATPSLESGVFGGAVSTFPWSMFWRPSLESGVFGGGAMNLALLKNPLKVERWTPEFNWKRKFTPPTQKKAFKGVIGARTAYSGGSGTVPEWVAAAKKRGLDYLVFLEKFSELTKEEFDKLVKECKTASGDSFLAIPGFFIDDEVGNHYYYYGTALGYPDKKLLDKTGKFFVSYDYGINPDNPHIPGQLSMTTLEYAHTMNSFKLSAGNFRFKSDNSPCANWFCNFDTTPVETRKDGKLEEDSLREYLEIVDAGQAPTPVAIELTTSPAKLADSPTLTVVRGDSLESVKTYWNTWHFYPNNPVRVFTTSGPIIENWSFKGPRDYEGFNKGDFVWRNQRWDLHGKVTTKIGLKEVAVYDGPTLFRRFLPKGKKVFEFTLALTHDKQHNLVLVTTDAAGGRAVSRELFDRNHRIEEFNCSDRNNQLTYSMTIDKNGYKTMLGGNQTLATPNKRVASGEVSPIGIFRNDSILGIPAFDGAGGHEPTFFMDLIMKTKSGGIHPPSAVDARRFLHTGDVNIGEGVFDHSFTDGVRVANVWHTLWRVEPTKDFTVTRHTHFFRVDPDSPLAVLLWDAEFTLKRDIPNNGMLVAHVRRGDDEMVTLRGSDGEVVSALWESESKTYARTVTLPFDTGAYLANIASPLGSLGVFSLSKGLEASVRLPKRSRGNIAMTPAATPSKKGDSARVRLLLIAIPRNTIRTKSLSASSNEVFEKFRTQFGFSNRPAEYTAALDAGSVTDQRYPLSAKLANGAFSGKIKGNLITTLPIQLSEANERWSAYLYDRKLKGARPLGVVENTIWATITLHGGRDIFIGHPVTCDNNDVFIQVTRIGTKKWRIDFNNPTDKELTIKPLKSQFFDPANDWKDFPATLAIPAGGNIILEK